MKMEKFESFSLEEEKHIDENLMTTISRLLIIILQIKESITSLKLFRSCKMKERKEDKVTFHFDYISIVVEIMP